MADRNPTTADDTLYTLVQAFWPLVHFRAPSLSPYASSTGGFFGSSPLHRIVKNWMQHWMPQGPVLSNALIRRGTHYTVLLARLTPRSFLSTDKYSPPSPCTNTGQILVVGPKMRKHGVAVFRQARWYVAGSPAVKRELFTTTQGCPAGQHTPQNTRAHGLHLHQHFDSHIDPSCSLHKPTNDILY